MVDCCCCCCKKKIQHLRWWWTNDENFHFVIFHDFRFSFFLSFRRFLFLICFADFFLYFGFGLASFFSYRFGQEKRNENNYFLLIWFDSIRYDQMKMYVFQEKCNGLNWNGGGGGWRTRTNLTTHTHTREYI